MDDQALSPVIDRVLSLISDPKSTAENAYEREAAHQLLLAAADAWVVVIPNPKDFPANTAFILPAKVGVVVTDRLIPGIGCSYELKRTASHALTCSFWRGEAGRDVNLDAAFHKLADNRVALCRTEAEARKLMRKSAKSG